MLRRLRAQLVPWEATVRAQRVMLLQTAAVSELIDANEGQYAKNRCDGGYRGRLVSCERVQSPCEASTARCGDAAT